MDLIKIPRLKGTEATGDKGTISTSLGIVETKVQKLHSAFQAASKIWGKAAQGRWGVGEWAEG